MTDSVCVIIINWNGRHLLEACLPAVLSQTYPVLEVIVVDNASTDGSAEWVAKHYPQVRLIRNASNRGFAAANNQAFAATSAPYLAPLNNDAAPEPTWLAEMLRVMTSDPCIGMCAAKVLRWDDHTILDSAGLAPDRSGTFWQLGHGQPDRSSAAEPHEVFGASGAACLLRRTMLEQIGGYDEHFFMYLEDADLAWRARLAGWRCLCVPTARVYHRHSASSGQGSPLKGYYLGRNKWWTIVKNEPSTTLLCNLPIIVGRDLLAVAYHLLARRDVHPLCGRLAALGSLPAVLDKRRAVQRLATPAGRRAAWQLRAPLWQWGHRRPKTGEERSETED